MFHFFREPVTCTPPPSANKAAHTGDFIRSPKHGYQWPNKKDLCSPKNFFNKECIPVGCIPPAAVAVHWGVCLSACWDTPPWVWAWSSPRVWAWSPLGVGLDPPRCGSGAPQGWAWRTPLARPLNFPPLGCGP